MSVGVASGYPQLAENEKDLLLKVYVDFPSSLNGSGTLQCVLGADTVRGGLVCSFDVFLKFYVYFFKLLDWVDISISSAFIYVAGFVCNMKLAHLGHTAKVDQKSEGNHLLLILRSC